MVLLQEHALLLAESHVYTTLLYHDVVLITGVIGTLQSNPPPKNVKF